MRVIVRCQESCDGVRGQLWPVDACQGNVSAPSEATDGPRRLATCDLRSKPVSPLASDDALLDGVAGTCYLG